MKKALFIFLVLVFLPYAIFAVSNAKVNGQKEIVITQLPADIVFTCDLAQAGNKLAFEYFVDMDMDGKVSQLEEIIDFFYVTEGIGWIRDSENPDNDFAGDETAVDGKLKITTTIEQQEVLIPSGIFGLMKVTDEDGSSDMVKIKIQITPQPPFIQGKVTNAVNGNPIQNAFIVAEKQDESVFGVTDVNGDYVIAVTNGTYQVVAMEFPMQNFQMSDTASVTVANN